MSFTQKQAKQLLPVFTAWANGEAIQRCSQFDKDKTWKDVCPDDSVSFSRDHKLYRIKPKVININGFEVPEPYRAAPSDYTQVFIPLTTSTDSYVVAQWDFRNDAKNHNELLRLGMLHKTREAAELHVKALRSFTEQPEN